MAKMINWNTAAFEAECVGVTMDRLEVAARVIAADARQILGGKLKGGWKEHGPYKSYFRKHRSTRHGRGQPRERVFYEGDSWTERRHRALVATIRVVRKNDSSCRNIWIMAGNYNVWWALQTEYGRGGWKGGAKPFLRPAMKNAPSSCRGILEGGAVAAEEI